MSGANGSGKTAYGKMVCVLLLPLARLTLLGGIDRLHVASRMVSQPLWHDLRVLRSFVPAEFSTIGVRTSSKCRVRGE